MTRYEVSGAGPDQVVYAASPEAAAQEVADFQYERSVTIEWIGTGPDRAIAEYRVADVEGDGYQRIVVRAALGSP